MNMRKLASDYQKFLNSKVPESIVRKTIQNNSNFIIDNEKGFMLDIYTKLLNDRIVFLNDEIDNYTSELIKNQLLYLEQLDHRKDIKMYINSPGGSVYDGLGILDTMDFIRPDVITINTGLAASMAAVILCAGAKGKRKSLKRARTMIHQPMSGSYGVYQASDITIDAKEINTLKIELYEIISEKTGQDIKKVEQDADRDYWMNSIEAKNYGMIDEVIKPRKK
jgi:ATP-dependent Clp protease protease subunit